MPIHPQSLIEIVLEPKKPPARRSLADALAALIALDSRLKFSTDQESGQTLLTGDSLDQLDRAIGDLLARGVEIDIGAPQVAYRESLGKKVDIDYTHKKQTGGAGQFARVMITFEPGEAGSSFVFESKIVGGAVPKEFIPGVEKGLESIKESGLLAGFPLIDFKATLTDGKYHDVDSSVLAFEIAARAAFRELREKGAPLLLEPVMRMEAVIAADQVAKVAKDLNGWRGDILSVEALGADQQVVAFVPLANLLGGFGSFWREHVAVSVAFDHYAPVPTVDHDPDLFPPAAAMRA